MLQDLLQESYDACAITGVARRSPCWAWHGASPRWSVRFLRDGFGNAITNIMANFGTS